MSNRKETIKILDKYGFVYEILIEHSPHFGFSTAYFNETIIGQVQLGRILQPTSDDDREWELYEERFSEWSDEIKSNLIPMCKAFFNENKL